MLFDQRTRAKLRAAGLDHDTLRRIESEVAEQARADADAVAGFFEGLDLVYSDMALTHSREEYPEHALVYVDLFTHSQDVRGFIRFETWGAYVEGARVLEGGAVSNGASGSDGDPESDGDPVRVVELELGPTVHDRVRFARDRAVLE